MSGPSPPRHAEPRLLLLDLDNTLYDWVGFFVPSLLAMVQEVCRELETADRRGILAEFQSVYARYGSVEYGFCIQALPSVASLSRVRREQVAASGRDAFQAERSRSLALYPGVRRTLSRLHAEGVIVIATTNAPFYQAWRRLERLNLARFFSGVTARQSFSRPAHNGSPAGKSPFSGRPPDHVWQFTSRHLKPASTMYETVLKETGVNPESTLVVGDQIAVDIEPALTLGMRAAWARYGARVDEGLWEQLLTVTPWDRRMIARRGRAKPDGVAALESFDQVLDLI